MGDEPCDVGPLQAAASKCLYQSDLLRVESDGSIWGQVEVGTWARLARGDGRAPDAWEIRLHELVMARESKGSAPKRHHPAGIEPPDEQRAQRRAAERNLMDFYTDPRDYAVACGKMHGKPIEGDITRNVDAGKTFARLIRGS